MSLYLERFREALQSGKVKKLDFLYPTVVVIENIGTEKLAGMREEGIEPKRIYHDEVIFYFGRLYELLDFEELHFTGSFPDAEAIFNGKKVRIEFEVQSSDFDHDPSQCDIIVCWHKDKDVYDGRRKLEILELEPFMKVYYNYTKEF